jgi:uncharacterized membrane protein (UPF0127 family)
MFKSLFLPLIAVAAFIVVAGLFMQGKLGNFKTTNATPVPAISEDVSLKEIKIAGKSLLVEVARTNSERATGLSNRQSIPSNQGMIFVFNPPTSPNFWMKDTLITLDMIWIKDSKITGITKNVQPQPGASDYDLELYPAPGAVDYVLEVNGGFADKNSLKVNDTVDTSQI